MYGQFDTLDLDREWAVTIVLLQFCIKLTLIELFWLPSRFLDIIRYFKK